jgi:methylmalonyl-CoA mutase N-terminal domain/subunit
MQNEIAQSAYNYQRRIETVDQVIVGVNRFVSQQEDKVPLLRVDDHIRTEQSARLKTLRNNRNNENVKKALEDIRQKAVTGENLMPSVIKAVEEKCTLGEIADTLRKVFGEYS